MNTLDDELIAKWKNRIKLGIAARKKWRETFRVDDLDKYYEGFQQPTWWNEVSFVPINLIFANIKSQLDAFKALSPKLNVRPARAMATSPQIVAILEQQAILRENVLNYIINRKNFKRELVKTRLDSFVSFGVVKIIYEPYYKSNPNAGKPYKNLLGKPVVSSTGETETEPDDILDNELFSISRRNSANIIIDPIADSIENITWVAEEIEFTLEELQENPLFKNTSDIKPISVRVEEKVNELQRKVGSEVASAATSGPTNSFTSTTLDNDKLIHVWEIYDLEERRIICLVEGDNKIIRNDPTPKGIETHPYVFLWFNDRRNTPYPIPEIWAQVGPQDEYNITRNQIMLHRKRFNRKYTVEEGAIGEDELSKLEEPYDGLTIKVKGSGEVIRPIQDPPLDQAVYFDVDMLRKDFMDISGAGVPEGEIAKIEKATVANIVSNRQQNRQFGNNAVISDFLTFIARKLMVLLENELTVPFSISINGPEGAAWKNVNPDALTGSFGEFDYELSASSLTPRDPDSERTAWVAFCQFIAMNPLIMQSPLFIKRTAKMFGVEDVILVEEVQKIAIAMHQQQMMQGGQAGQPSMSPDMQKALGYGGA